MKLMELKRRRRSKGSATPTFTVQVVAFLLCLTFFYTTTIQRFLLRDYVEDIIQLAPFDEQTISTTSTPVKTNLTVVVPGFGSLNRLPIMAKSIKKIKESLNTEEGNGFHCIIYVYKTEVIFQTKEELPFCDVKYNAGLWTHHMAAVPSPVPQVIISRPPNSVTSTPSIGATHVAVLMDDVDLYTHSFNNINSMLTQMSKMNYDVMSASVLRHDTYEAMHPRKECVSHETSFTDVLFTVYDAQAWACWQSQIDLDMNPTGWGYDMTFIDMCGVKIGIMDDFVAMHSSPDRTYEEGSAFEDMWNWVDHIAKVHKKKHGRNLPGYGSLYRNERIKVKKMVGDEAYSKLTKAEAYRFRVMERFQMYPKCDGKRD